MRYVLACSLVLAVLAGCMTFEQPEALPADSAAAQPATTTELQEEQIELPAHVSIRSTFADYGLQFEEIPEPKQGFGVTYAVSSDEELDVIGTVKRDGENTWYMVETAAHEGTWRFAYDFPESGAYYLAVDVRPAGSEDHYSEAARVTVTVDIPEGHVRYTWTGWEEAIPIVVKDVREVEDNLRVGSTLYFSHRVATVVGDYRLPTPFVDVELADGSEIQIPNTTPTDFSSFVVAPGRDMAIECDGASIVFAAGAPLEVAETLFRGTLAEPIVRAVGAAAVEFPRGSKVGIRDGTITRLSSEPPVQFAYRGTTIPVAQVSYRTALEPVRAYVATSGSAIADISGLRFHLPDNAILVVENEIVERIYASEPFEFERGGEVVVVEPSQIVLFDSDGAFKGVQQPVYHGSGYY